MITPGEAVKALVSANPALVAATFEALDYETHAKLLAALTILATGQGAEQ
ncbi:hypothetical protein BH09ACT7_BH09ACT7_05050 [soil metagenome]